MSFASRFTAFLLAKDAQLDLVCLSLLLYAIKSTAVM